MLTRTYHVCRLEDYTGPVITTASAAMSTGSYTIPYEHGRCSMALNGVDMLMRAVEIQEIAGLSF